MSGSRTNFDNPEDRIFLTVDNYNFVNLLHIRADFGDVVLAVKLGVQFIRSKQAARIRRHLSVHDMPMFLDAKFGESAKLMGGAINKYEKDGYRYLSVNAGVDPRALVAARLAATNSRVVVAIPPNCPKMLGFYLDNIDEANDQLGQHRLTEVMCDVADLPQTRLRSSEFVITATGISNPNSDNPYADGRMPPAEALFNGADRLAIGSAVMGARNTIHAMHAVLANIATAL